MTYFLRQSVSVAFMAATLSGCAVPRYDVRYSSTDQPTVASIDERIQCELRDMVRSDVKEDPNTFHREFLLNGDYEVKAQLSIETNNTGGLIPTLAYIDPLKAATSFVFGGTGTLSESRDHTFTVNLKYFFKGDYDIPF